MTSPADIKKIQEKLAKEKAEKDIKRNQAFQYLDGPLATKEDKAIADSAMKKWDEAYADRDNNPKWFGDVAESKMTPAEDDRFRKAYRQAANDEKRLLNAAKTNVEQQKDFDRRNLNALDAETSGYKKGGKVKAKSASKPKASSASRRADGCAVKGKTKGRIV